MNIMLQLINGAGMAPGTGSPTDPGAASAPGTSFLELLRQAPLQLDLLPGTALDGAFSASAAPPPALPAGGDLPATLLASLSALAQDGGLPKATAPAADADVSADAVLDPAEALAMTSTPNPAAEEAPVAAGLAGQEARQAAADSAARDAAAQDAAQADDNPLLAALVATPPPPAAPANPGKGGEGQHGAPAAALDLPMQQQPAAAQPAELTSSSPRMAPQAEPVAVAPTAPSPDSGVPFPGGQDTAPASAASSPSSTLDIPGASRQLQAPLASPQWRQELGQQMASIARHGDGRVSLHLNPADLGPLTVEVKMTEQHAQLQFLSAHAQVRMAVEQALPQLREALAEQGISLGETTVGEQRGDERQSFLSQGREQGGGNAGIALGDTDAAAPQEPVAPVPEGQVNLYV